MKTIEERTKEIIIKYGCPEPTLLKGLIESAMRALVEDIAKIADEEAGAMSGVAIDSLASGDPLRAARAGSAFDSAKRITNRIREQAGLPVETIIDFTANQSIEFEARWKQATENNLIRVMEEPTNED